MQLSAEIQQLKDQIELKLNIFDWGFLESQRILNKNVELVPQGFKISFTFMKDQIPKNVSKSSIFESILKFCKWENYEIQKDYATRYIIIPFNSYSPFDF